MSDGAAAPDELLQRRRHFHSDYFPLHQQRFQDLVIEGQHPKILFIGCLDSRLVPYLLTGAGPGELFIVRNVGTVVPPYDQSHGLHGTMAAIEHAVLGLQVERSSFVDTSTAARSAWHARGGHRPDGLAEARARGRAAGPTQPAGDGAD